MNTVVSDPSVQTRRFVAVCDRSHLRIYVARKEIGMPPGGLQLAEAIDLPAGRTSYAERNTDVAGRFPGTNGQGGGIDERLPMKENEERRCAELLAERLNEFFRGLVRDTWDLAVSKTLFTQVIDRLESGPRSRLRRALPKDLVKESAGGLRAHFALA